MKLVLLIVALYLAMLSATTLQAFAAAQSLENRKLFVEGAKLWPVYCAQCHNARPGSQFSPAQWNTITMHMRTQSIMPAKDMRAIKEFLQEAR
jgi:mono/diheme cytochrome c family protein